MPVGDCGPRVIRASLKSGQREMVPWKKKKKRKRIGKGKRKDKKKKETSERKNLDKFPPFFFFFFSYNRTRL